MSGNNRIANMLTARSALLDFYSDRAVAFASFFVASIFGLVTTLALIQRIEIEKGNLGNLSACWLDLAAIVGSLVAYVFFAYAVQYTFKRFAMYSSIADHLAVKGLHEYAKGEEVKFKIQCSPKDLELLRKAFREFKQEIKPKEKGQEVHFSAYVSYMSLKRTRFLLRKYEKYFELMLGALMLLLALLGYYPILSSLF